MALLVGLVVINAAQDENGTNEVAEVDAALLTDELPPAAYSGRSTSNSGWWVPCAHVPTVGVRKRLIGTVSTRTPELPCQRRLARLSTR